MVYQAKEIFASEERQASFDRERLAAKKELENRGYRSWVCEMVKYVGEDAGVAFERGAAVKSSEDPKLDPYWKPGGLQRLFSQFLRRLHPDKFIGISPRNTALLELQLDDYNAWRRKFRSEIPKQSFLGALLRCADRHNAMYHGTHQCLFDPSTPSPVAGD